MTIVVYTFYHIFTYHYCFTIHCSCNTTVYYVVSHAIFLLLIVRVVLKTKTRLIWLFLGTAIKGFILIEGLVAIFTPFSYRYKSAEIIIFSFPFISSKTFVNWLSLLKVDFNLITTNITLPSRCELYRYM